MQNLPQLLEQGRQFHQAGRFAEAGQMYIQVLRADRRNFDARHLLGILCLQSGRPADAVSQFNAALSIRPDSADALSNCAVALQALGRLEESLTCLDRAIALAPRSADARSNRGNVLLDMGRLGEALASYDAALAVDPAHADGLNNRGNVLRRMGRLADALTDYDAALKIQKSNPEMLNNRGVVLRELGRFTESLASYDKALGIRPNHPETYNNRGAVLQDLARYAEALKDFDRALILKPGYAEALNNRGLVLQILMRQDEALKNFDAALASKPDYIDALVNRGFALAFLNRPEDAVLCFETVLAREPGHAFAFGGLAATAPALCDWPRRAKVDIAIAQRVREAGAIIPPLVLLDYSDEPALQFACARTFVDNHIRIAPAPLWQGTPYRHPRIRLAYVSADFRDHPVASLIAGLIETHDRARFEVIGISLSGDDGSAARARLESGFDQFHPVQDLGGETIARLLRRLEVDIAIDLMGHTRGARSEIFKFRPAPVQVNWLGYAGTMGADFIDYIIADPVALPFDRQAFFAEQIVHLPHCCLPNGGGDVGVAPSRREAGLPEEGFVFSGFHSPRKINAPVFDVWMRLLANVPGSLLWLRDDRQIVRDTLRREAGTRGVDPERLRFAPRTPTLAQHLARHRLADLSLDTVPYNAHTAASDSLNAGVPLLTCRGNGFAGRIAASVLTAANLPELVASSLSDYEAMALALAGDPPRLKSIRQKLAQARYHAPLFDAGRFRRAIECAYLCMHERSQLGEPAKSFAVVEDDPAGSVHAEPRT